MFGGRIAFIPGKSIRRIAGIERVQMPVAADFGQNRCRHDAAFDAIAADHGTTVARAGGQGGGNGSSGRGIWRYPSNRN